MVKSLADSVISFIELIEAEGRALRGNMIRFCFLAVFFIIAGAMTISGFVLLFSGLFNLIAGAFGKLSAYFATGSACILISVVFFAIGLRGMSIRRGRGEADFVDEWRAEGDAPLKGEGESEALSGDDKSDEFGGSASD
ncbi:MAG: hypothetical protein LBI74_09360 [Synergistaceae bacterium]|jgi:hypothetical protein|nr:hypothetical protein [Synergistaceae bacterium]